MKSVEERFWEKVAVEGPDECWEWLAYKNDAGYGQFKLDGKYRRAHRVAFQLVHGDLLDSDFLLHSCDNPGCVNPGHLRKGDHAENMRDMVLRGRSMVGRRHPLVKLTEQQILEIRASETTQEECAALYGVTRSNISSIQLRRSWRHVGER